MRVAIVALGQSGVDFVREAEMRGGRKHIADEVWAINGYGDVIQCDRIIHMDDVRIQEARAAAGNKKIGRMLEWMKLHPGPIVTSRAHPDYPGLVEFPLEAVINSVAHGRAYFNGTVAYAVALAIYEGAREIALYGADYAFRDAREEGRACVEYWLGIATAKGIKVKVTGGSSLLDADKMSVLYGYDTLEVKQEVGKTGQSKLVFADRQPPTAQEIEQRYAKFMPQARKDNRTTEVA